MLIRFPNHARSALGTAITDVVSRYADQLPGSFIVIQPGHVRISKHP
jgi:hypothetical protein